MRGNKIAGMDGDVCIVENVKQQKQFKISRMDLWVLDRATWMLDDKGYVIGYPSGYGKKIRLHRYIYGDECPEGMVIDHHNRDKSDNTRGNIRFVSQRQNSLNREQHFKCSSRITLEKGVICIITDDSKLKRFIAKDAYDLNIKERPVCETRLYNGWYSKEELMMLTGVSTLNDINIEFCYKTYTSEVWIVPIFENKVVDYRGVILKRGSYKAVLYFSVDGVMHIKFIGDFKTKEIAAFYRSKFLREHKIVNAKPNCMGFSSKEVDFFIESHKDDINKLYL